MSQKEELHNFPEKLAAAPAPRPHLTAQHSNSLPSSPYQNPRKLSFGGRSPSPEKLTKDASPDSNHSEPERRPRSGSKAPSLAGCKYETGMAFFRRRIPYSIGGDQLERAKAPPKKYLNPKEEGKLSGDMRELYDRILPSVESERDRTRFIQKLEQILNQRWPGNDIKVYVFGSSGNMLCTSDSDVDICITTPMKALERVCLLANALAEHGMERVVCVPHAKVPIVKFWDPELKLACDMNVNNTLALENTRMIKTYVEIDERVRPLAMIIKQWTKRRILNDAALGGTLSSYTWICLILSFLQTRNPPILPSLHKKPHLRKPGADGQIAPFDDDIDKLRGYGYHNSETLGELLFQFYRRYGYDFDYEKNVVSVREGKLLTKEAKKWNFMQNNRLCVEEPFNTERNLGNTADDTSFRGIHLELRRAFELVKDGKLDECLEEYVFPATEEKIWEKPAARPPPVLTRSRSQSGSTQSKRGGHNNRGGGRHNQFGQRSHTQHQPRRASSAAAQNKFSGTQLGLHSSGGRDYLPHENALRASLDQIQLHNELFTRYQILQAEEEKLRRIQTASQIQARIQAQRSHDDTSIPSQPRDQPHRLPSTNYIPFTAPPRSAQYFHPFPYPQVPGTPQQNVHTQPSSPSLKHEHPDLRRGVHRSSVADGTPSSNNRSHSQPARPIPAGLAVQNAPPLPLNSQAWLQYQHQLRQHQVYDTLEMRQPPYRPDDVQMYHDPRRQPLSHHFEESVPKEYVGYWVNDSPPPRHYREDPTLQRVPAFNELHPRVRGMPQSFSRLRNGSRSPSPSPALPFRDRSFSVRSASSAPPQPALARMERVPTISQGPRAAGPIVVNGQDGWIMPDYSCIVAEGSSHTTTISEATSGSDDRLYDTPASADAEISGGQGFGDVFAADEPQHFFHANPAAEGMRMPLTISRNGHSDPTIRRPSHQMNETMSPPNSTQRLDQGARSAGGLGIQFGEHQFNQPSTKPDPALQIEKMRPAVQKSPPTPKAEQTAVRTDNVPMPIPLLSPVREVTTPSPTAKRRQEVMPQPQSNTKCSPGKLDLYIPSFAEITRRKQENGVLDSMTNGVSPSKQAQSAKNAESPRGRHPPNVSPKSPKSHAQQPQLNGWQTQSGKKGKKSKSRPSSGQIMPAELVLSNDYERKGG